MESHSQQDNHPRRGSWFKGTPPVVVLAVVLAIALVLTGMQGSDGEQAGISVAEPIISVPMADGAEPGAGRAVPVIIVDDGVARQWFVTGRTVGDALRELGIPVSADDRIIPSPDTLLEERAAIQLIRPRVTVVEWEETIPHDTLRRHISTLPKGKETVLQEGKKGRVLKRIRQTIRDGVVIAEEVLEEKIIEPPVRKVILVGTRNSVVALSASSPEVDQVTRDGVTFGVKGVLDNVSLTAYHAGRRSTGKTEEHPQFGITYTGTQVQEGHTIAVDPDVIPLGWWVYIEGIGFRRAEDTGSAVKGKKIDIYMEDEQQALQFGVKQGHRVYLIGPDKPMP